MHRVEQVLFNPVHDGNCVSVMKSCIAVARTGKTGVLSRSTYVAQGIMRLLFAKYSRRILKVILGNIFDHIWSSLKGRNQTYPHIKLDSRVESARFLGECI